MLLEQEKKEEFCPICGFKIEESSYIYRHKAPSGYKCSNCGETVDEFYLLKADNNLEIPICPKCGGTRYYQI